MMRKHFILFGHIYVSVIIFAVLSIFIKSLTVSETVLTAIATLIFTMFGFSFTSFSIILGFMDRSEKIKKVISKGYYLSVVVSLVVLFLFAIFAVLALIFDLDSKFIFAVFIASTILIGYYIYFIIVLSVNYKREVSIKK